MSHEQPSLEDLGLDSPARVTPSGKLSIEELQRQSEREIDDRRPSQAAPVRQRVVAMDIGAFVLSLLIPGAGQLLKGRLARGAVWLALVFSAYAVCLLIATFLRPVVLIAVFVHILCMADAILIRVDE